MGVEGLCDVAEAWCAPPKSQTTKMLLAFMSVIRDSISSQNDY